MLVKFMRIGKFPTGFRAEKQTMPKGGAALDSACISSGTTSQIHTLSASRLDHRGFPIHALRPIGNIMFARKRRGIPPREGKRTAYSTYLT